MSSEYVGGRHERLDRRFGTIRANPVMAFIVISIVVVGLLCVAVALNILLSSDKTLRDAKVSRSSLEPTAVEDMMKKQTPQPQPDVSAPQETAVSVNTTKNNAGVSVNGTPISIPKNGSVHKSVRKESGNGNVKVSITSSSTSTEATDDVSSSMSINVQSSSISETEEGD